MGQRVSPSPSPALSAPLPFPSLSAHSCTLSPLSTGRWCPEYTLPPLAPPPSLAVPFPIPFQTTFRLRITTLRHWHCRERSGWLHTRDHRCPPIYKVPFHSSHSSSTSSLSACFIIFQCCSATVVQIPPCPFRLFSRIAHFDL